jgi:sirohydrochlorin ferrochelatase
MTGLIVFAHGSSLEAANEAVRDAAAAVRRRTEYQVEAAFLELAAPDLPAAMQKMVESGTGRIIIVPYFLTPGVHLTRDLPRIVSELRNIYQGVAIEVTESLDGHPALIEALLDRASQTYGGSSSEGQAG